MGGVRLHVYLTIYILVVIDQELVVYLSIDML
jgi:hypothetical protein